MKFSRSIQFNAVPDWSSYYISYSNLKKLIYTLEKSVNQLGNALGHDAEASPLLTSGAEGPDEVFRRALDVELEKICSFYEAKELELYEEVGSLLRDAEIYKNEKPTDDAHASPAEGPTRHRGLSNASGRGRAGSGHLHLSSSRSRRSSTMDASFENPDADSDEDALNDSVMFPKIPTRQLQIQTPYDGDAHPTEDRRGPREPRPSKRTASPAEYEEFSEHAFSTLYESRITLKKRTLNRTGFSKALKKYDKILNRNLRPSYMEQSISSAPPFKKETMQQLEQNISNVEKIYADIVTNGDIREAQTELRSHLREHVVWERNTVWREMIGIERRAQAAKVGFRGTILGRAEGPSSLRRQGDNEDDSGSKEIVTPIGRVYCPNWLFSGNFLSLVVILLIFIILLNVSMLEKPEQQNCLAMLVFVSLLWATEVIPIFVTSILIPFLVVTLRIVCSEEKPYHRLGSKAAAAYIFSAMWSPVIMLLLGGFTIAAALSKYHIAKILATFVLSKAGTRPRTVLLTNMFVAMIASMWISNVAAPVLCYSIIQPILRNLPPDSEFSKALVLAIALASCIGGMASPIASPQNIIALENMQPEPSWGAWFFVTLPICIMSIFLVWLLLLVSFRPGKGTTIIPVRRIRDRFTGVHWFISVVTIVTILLWCVTHRIERFVGDMGVVAILPMVLFFGTGVLTKEDFNNFLWTIVILAAGGLSLGKAVNSSGLLHTIANAITAKVEGMGLFGVFIVFSALILVVASFISHTVAALIILPIVRQVGAGMDDPHPNLLVMGSALMCSAAMALPTSGFPNMTAIMMEDSQTGQRYLRVRHFISRGIPSSILTWAVVITVGYGLMMVVGF